MWLAAVQVHGVGLGSGMEGAKCQLSHKIKLAFPHTHAGQ